MVSYYGQCPTCGGRAKIVGDDNEGNRIYEHDDGWFPPNARGHVIEKVIADWNNEEQRQNLVLIHSADCPGCVTPQVEGQGGER